MKIKRSSIGKRQAKERCTEPPRKGVGVMPNGRKVTVNLPLEKYTIIVKSNDTRSDEEIIASYEKRRQSKITMI